MYKKEKIYNNKNGDNMKVKELMTNKLIVCEETDSMHRIAQKMKKYDIGFMPITSGHQIIGVITDRDIAINMISNYDHEVPNYITKNIISIDINDDIKKALEVMKNNKIKRLIVTNGKIVSGIISLSDILKTNEYDIEFLNTVKSIYKVNNNIDKISRETNEYYL